MRRGEALAVMGIGTTAATAGLVWLFGAWPLVAVGLLVTVVALFVVDVDGGGP